MIGSTVKTKPLARPRSLPVRSRGADGDRPARPRLPTQRGSGSAASHCPGRRPRGRHGGGRVWNVGARPRGADDGGWPLDDHRSRDHGFALSHRRDRGDVHVDTPADAGRTGAYQPGPQDLALVPASAGRRSSNGANALTGPTRWQLAKIEASASRSPFLTNWRSPSKQVILECPVGVDSSTAPRRMVEPQRAAKVAKHMIRKIHASRLNVRIAKLITSHMKNRTRLSRPGSLGYEPIALTSSGVTSRMNRHSAYRLIRSANPLRA
jgi:hypothetical protein